MRQESASFIIPILEGRKSLELTPGHTTRKWQREFRSSLQLQNPCSQPALRALGEQ